MNIVSISSLQNANIKKLKSLKEKKYRDIYNLFVVEGIREIKAALKGGFKIKEIFVCKEVLSQESKNFWEQLQNKSEIKKFFVTHKIFTKIAIRENVDGILGVFQKKSPLNLKDLKLNKASVFVVIENIEKPGNLGAILRTSDAFGVNAVILVGKSCDFYNHNAIRASIGTVFVVPILYADTNEVIKFCLENNIKIFSTSPHANLNYYEINFGGPCAIVLGSEAYGIRELWNQNFVTAIKIPMYGYADSLNISVAGGIILAEIQRQKLIHQS